MTIEAFPLCWPTNRPRSKSRESARFSTGFAKARNKIVSEISLLGGRNAIISTNIELRRDGLPYATYRTPEDSGVAVYFTYKGRQMCFACDRWRKVEDNMHAINLTIGALRGVARWGTGDMMQAAFTGFTALPAPGQSTARSWRDVLDVPADMRPDAQLERVRMHYRAMASARHPDKPGGSHAAMSELNAAWAQAQEAFA